MVSWSLLFWTKILRRKTLESNDELQNMLQTHCRENFQILRPLWEFIAKVVALRSAPSRLHRPTAQADCSGRLLRPTAQANYTGRLPRPTANSKHIQRWILLINEPTDFDQLINICLLNLMFITPVLSFGCLFACSASRIVVRLSVCFFLPSNVRPAIVPNKILFGKGALSFSTPPMLFCVRLVGY